MLTACWSVKGGSGTTVIAASLVLAAAEARRPVVAVDLGGDLPLTLAMPERGGQGVADWLRVGRDVAPDALARLGHRHAQGITMIESGARIESLCDVPAEAGTRLAAGLRRLEAGAPVIADCGRPTSPAVAAFVEAADRSLLVIRNCYIAMRRAKDAPRPTAIVLVREPHRALGARDIEDALQVPVAAEVVVDPDIARVVDQGLLNSRVPKRLAGAMRVVAA